MASELQLFKNLIFWEIFSEPVILILAITCEQIASDNYKLYHLVCFELPFQMTYCKVGGHPYGVKGHL